jgi:hypothetical protein
MIAFIDDHREAYEIGSICKVLPIAPCTCTLHMRLGCASHKLTRRAGPLGATTVHLAP